MVNISFPLLYTHKLRSEAKFPFFLTVSLKDLEFSLPIVIPKVSKQLPNPGLIHKILLMVFHAFVTALIKAL